MSDVFEFVRRCEVGVVISEIESNPALIISDGKSLLELSMAVGCFPLVRFFIKQKGVRFQSLVLDKAVELILQNDVNAIQQHIKHHPQLLKPNCFSGKSLLEIGIILGCLPIVRFLVTEKGIRNTKDIIRLSARNYHYLPIRVSADIALFIFSCRAENIKNSEFLFQYFIENLKTKEKKKAIEEAVSSACSCDNAEYLEWFVSLGVDVNFDRQGDTPLIKAASVGANTVAEALIRNGAKVNKIVRGRGRNADALWTAVCNQHVDTVKLLLSHGANPYNTIVSPLKDYPYSPHGNAIDAALMMKNKTITEILIQSLVNNKNNS